MRRDVFKAISDPNRRAIIDLLAKETLKLNEVAEYFDISRPAVSKHIKILKECGLIKIKQKGRERFCELRHLPLNEVSKWIDHHNKFWDKKLMSLKKQIEKKA